MALVELDHAGKDYLTDGVRVSALRDVCLRISRGEFVALTGPSGCGKSTLLNLAGAMDFPTSGRVLLEGVETSALDDRGLTRLRREKVGFVFQSFQLIDTLSAVENVELPLLLAGRASVRARATECLRQVEMEPFAARMPYQLSGGERQRVAIARALVHSPALLLADEPTGNLDSATGKTILELLRGIAGKGATAVLMATHSLEAAGAAGSVVRLRDGHVESVEEAAPRR